MSSNSNCVKDTRVDSNGLPKLGACADPTTGGPGYVTKINGFNQCCDWYPSTNSWEVASNVNFNDPRLSNPFYSKTSSGIVYTPVKQQTRTVSTPVSSPYTLSDAAAGCISGNPNYPSLKGSCVLNPQNPCPTHYETTDTRFGTKMCCAPKNDSNVNCFNQGSNKGVSTFGAVPRNSAGVNPRSMYGSTNKKKKGLTNVRRKSTFGASGASSSSGGCGITTNTVIIILAVLLLLFLAAKKYKWIK